MSRNKNHHVTGRGRRKQTKVLNLSFMSSETHSVWGVGDAVSWWPVVRLWHLNNRAWRRAACEQSWRKAGEMENGRSPKRRRRQDLDAGSIRHHLTSRLREAERNGWTRNKWWVRCLKKTVMKHLQQDTPEGKLQFKRGKKGEGKEEDKTCRGMRKEKKQHTAALSPDFPPACSQTSSFNLFFQWILRRVGRITTMQAYQLASMLLMMERKKLREL